MMSQHAPSFAWLIPYLCCAKFDNDGGATCQMCFGHSELLMFWLAFCVANNNSDFSLS